MSLSIDFKCARSLFNHPKAGIFAEQDVPKYTDVYSSRQGSLVIFDGPALKFLENDDPQYFDIVADNGFTLPGAQHVFYDMRVCDMQHSDKPNCEFYFCEGHKNQVQVIAKRHIMKGEELTINYLSDLDETFARSRIIDQFAHIT